MTNEATEREPAREELRRRFRVTLVRVMSVQVVTLLLLWLLQHAFSS
jgi:hypothetical protein